MKNKIFAIVVLLITSLLLIGCIKSPSQEEAVSQEEKEITSDTVLDDELFIQAINGRDLEKCSKIMSGESRSECEKIIESLEKRDLAITTQDIVLCEEIELERYKEDCADSVSKKLDKERVKEETLNTEQAALDSGDASTCDSIEDKNKKAACKYNVIVKKAIAEKDPDLCEGIGEPIAIEECQMQAASEEE